MRVKQIFFIIILFALIILFCTHFIGNETEVQNVKNTSLEFDIQEYIMSEIESGNIEEQESFIGSLDFDDEESYLLAKLAMAEAEGESTETKALVILVVLNRVWSNEFPDTIEEVIFQKNQFSVIASGGRWWTVEPNDDCYAALDMVRCGRDESHGALYFEACENENNWHSNNLEFICQSDNTRFYK